MGSLEHQLCRQNGPQLLNIHKITHQLIPTVFIIKFKECPPQNNITYFFSGTRPGDDLAKGRERQLATEKRAERTKHDFRSLICLSVIG